MELKNKLKELRTSRNMTQEAVAEETAPAAEETETAGETAPVAEAVAPAEAAE